MKLFSVTYRLIFILVFLLLTELSTNAQAILDANGPGKTYELIDSILAPISYPAIESPDQSGGTHISFGRHIVEVWDTTLKKYVFEFYIHALIDNDVATQDTDRQRVEIKTYAPSPDSVKGKQGDLMTFKWMFRLPKGFQPSLNFTHIHQIKGVGGDDNDPIFTLSPVIVSGTPKLCVRYVSDSIQSNSSNSFTLLTSSNLSKFLGVWLQVTEVIKFDSTTAGSYSIKITKVGDTAVLLKYNSTAIKTIRASNTFARPKWGIYRSILSPSYLRDDSLRLAHITIYKGLTALPVNIINFNVVNTGNNVCLKWTVEEETSVNKYIIESSDNGVDFRDIFTCMSSYNKFYTYTDQKTLDCKYYRLKVVNSNGTYFYSKIILVNPNLAKINLYPNPASSYITINTKDQLKNAFFTISTISGNIVEKGILSNFDNHFPTTALKNGIYFFQLFQNNKVIFNTTLFINK